jgi:hypothetical protein
MKRSIQTILLSVLLLSPLQAVQDTELSEKLFNALVSSNRGCIEQLMQKHDLQRVLTQKQREALWDTACAAVRHRKAHVRTVFGIPVDSAKLKQGTLLGVLGVSSILLGSKIAPQQQSKPADSEVKLQNKRRSSSFSKEEIQQVSDESEVKLFKIRGILKKPIAIPQWASHAFVWAGIGSLGHGLWKIVQAFQLYELSQARSIKLLMKKALNQNVATKEQKAEALETR